jgi:hypothetical protein
MAGRHFAQHGMELRRQAHGKGAAPPRGGQHLELQAAPAGRQVDLLDQRLGRHLRAGRAQHRGQGRGAAFVLALGKERHLRQFGARRQAGGRRARQRLRLRRRQQRATAQAEGQRRREQRSDEAARARAACHRATVAAPLSAPSA